MTRGVQDARILDRLLVERTAERDRAREIAVALEQENAELRRRMGMYEDWQRQDGDVVGQEGLPLGDPWGDSPIPDDWRDEP